MGEFSKFMICFFQGWKRKIGCVTLLMALVFMGLWVRSGVMNDFIATDGKNATYRLGSYGGMLNFIRDTPPTTFGRFLHLDSFDEGPENNKYELWASWNSWTGYQVEWQWHWGQFHFGAGTLLGARTVSFVFPYWSITIPLTLLSAFLLLAKPRPSTQKKPTEPTPAEGA